MKKLSTFLSILTVAFIALLFQQCYTDGFDDRDSTKTVLTDGEYETILKDNVNALIAQSSKTSDHFLFQQGLPVWDKAKWVDVNSKRMLVVPLATRDGSKKFIVGTASGREIPAVVTEMSPGTRASGGNRIYSLQSEVLYEDGSLTSFIPRTRSFASETIDCTAMDLLFGGGCAEDWFLASGEGAEYNPNAMAGTLSICTDDGNSSSSIGFNTGHAWLEFTDNNGNVTAIGTWGPGYGDNGPGYYLNFELEDEYQYGKISYGQAISYAQFQDLLNYNSTDGNQDWTLLSNCSTYASGAWGAATGNGIDMGDINTPTQIADYIRSRNGY